jgi:hypothetical protein
MFYMRIAYEFNFYVIRVAHFSVVANLIFSKNCKNRYFDKYSSFEIFGCIIHIPPTAIFLKELFPLEWCPLCPLGYDC